MPYCRECKERLDDINNDFVKLVERNFFSELQLEPSIIKVMLTCTKCHVNSELYLDVDEKDFQKMLRTRGAVSEKNFEKLEDVHDNIQSKRN